MTYLYAIVWADQARCLGAISGLNGAEVRTVNTGRLAALVSDAPLALAPSLATVWEHERVVEAAIAEGPAVPVRLGTVLPDDNEVVGLLARRAGEFQAALRRLEGMVELMLHVEDGAEPPPELAKLARGVAGGRRGTPYLVPRAEVDRFVAAVASAEAHGPRALVTGPWPPYSFVGPEGADAG